MTSKPFVSLSIIAALMLIMPLWVSAFSLGKIEVSSALNQPFQAVIPVNAIRDDERSNLQVALASDADFERAGIERSLVLTQLQFAITEKNGKTLIEVRSQLPVKEPILDFLITASAGEGRMLKSYTALLDPPDSLYRQKLPESLASRTVNAKSTQPNTNNPRRYQVTETDTLWRIASNNRPDNNLTVQQMMMAILDANPSAFQEGNINGLMAGMQIEIPATDEIEPINATAASQAVKEQTADWQRRQQPAVANNATEAADNTPVQSVAESESAETQDSTAEKANIPGDDPQQSTDTVAEFSEFLQLADNQQNPSRLDIIAADTNIETPAINESEQTDSQAADLQRLNTRLTLAQETIAAQSDENVDLSGRLDDLETQLETMRRLLSLRDADMARLQAMLDDPPQPDQSKTTAPVTADGQLDLPAAQQVANNTVDTISDDPDTVPSVQKPLAAQFFDNAKAFVSQNLLLILLVFLLLLLLFWFWQRRRQETYTEINALHQEPKFEERSDVSLSNNMVAPEVTEIDDINQTETTNAVDASTDQDIESLKARANMFIGYADYDQARTVLQKAQTLSSGDKSITALLLYVLYKQRDITEFEKVFEDSGIDSSHPEWSDIITWRQALRPEDDRFDHSQQSQPEGMQVYQEIDVTDDEAVAQQQDEKPTDTVDDEQQTADSAEFIEDAPLDFDYEQYSERTVEKEKNDSDDTESVRNDNSAETLNFFDEQTADSDAGDAAIHTEPEITADNVLPENKLDNEVVESDPEPIPLYANEQPFSDQEDTSEQSPTIAADNESGYDNDAGAEAEMIDFALPVEKPLVPDTEDAAVQTEADSNSSDQDEEMELDFDLGGFDDMDEAETKLDLAAAYIEIGDQSAARDILQEVLTEASEIHKQRAQALLNELN